MTEEQKKWIDDADYETLLRQWRFGKTGDPLFQGETGEYYKKVMAEKRDADPVGAVAASKSIGWA